MSTETIASPVQTTKKSADGVSQACADASAPLPGQPPRFQNILAAVDFSEYSTAALNYASFLAESFGAKLTLVHAVEPYVYPEDLSAGYPIDELDARWIQKAKDSLESLCRTMAKNLSPKVIVTMGAAWNRIVGTAASINADLIVVGTHGRTGLQHVLMGSTAERVSRHATCPVLIVHCPEKRGKSTDS